MIDTISDLLRCPVCRLPFAVQQAAVRCESGHSFDVARQGYVNLLTRPPRGVNADTGEMIAARDRLLSAGHYAPLADRLARVASEVVPSAPAMLEAGAGTGYYLDRVINRLPAARGVGTDLSPYACRRIARIDRAGAVVADTWAGLPVRDQVLDLIMVVFAPRNPADFARMLRPGGRLLIAAANGDHLAEVRHRLGMIDVRPGKSETLRTSLQEWYQVEHSEEVRAQLLLDRSALTDLVLMGPTAHHRPDDLPARIAALPDPTAVTLSVGLSTFRRRLR
ncbi:putative RNA methyltransferase [Microlunatus sp. Gsoil 973]|jgi:23S rRNA (guanine745-N1)-methyltransferase|uniref:putative RNA methyltransferase n=1 Tax=Microlunatus sp. Gsoil 973 TaxID=2672569 RepID=UPI0012B45B3A|nr:hypothetical protein [Microlunatus sp. Gsoil 973]QGN31988.1 hypothetical protein GJV80_03345 [Microlunatus sp. Gsoil 973]